MDGVSLHILSDSFAEIVARIQNTIFFPPSQFVISSSIAASQPSLLEWLYLDSATCSTASKRTHSRLDNDVQHAQLYCLYKALLVYYLPVLSPGYRHLHGLSSEVKQIFRDFVIVNLLKFFLVTSTLG
jgi:hypothetical protein